MKSGFVHWFLLGGTALVLVCAIVLFNHNFERPQLNFDRSIGNIGPSPALVGEAGDQATKFPAVVIGAASPTPNIKPVSLSNITVCPNYSDALALREFIFCAFGFRAEVAGMIRNSTMIEVQNMNATTGGGFWYADSKKVFLYTAQREAALHEISHAFWEKERGSDTRRLNLVRDLIKLANLNKNANPEYINAINFAHEYVYGKGNWKGMFCSVDGGSCAGKTPQDLTDSLIVDYTNRGVINDHEIYAGFSSWTMGRLRSGSHKLPDFMANNFDEEFTGTISEVPYFDGGSP